MRSFFQSPAGCTDYSCSECASAVGNAEASDDCVDEAGLESSACLEDRHRLAGSCRRAAERQSCERRFCRSWLCRGEWFHVQRVPKNKSDAFASTEIGKPVPGENAFESHDDLLPI